MCDCCTNSRWHLPPVCSNCTADDGPSKTPPLRLVRIRQPAHPDRSVLAAIPNRLDRDASAEVRVDQHPTTDVHGRVGPLSGRSGDRAETGRLRRLDSVATNVRRTMNEHYVAFAPIAEVGHMDSRPSRGGNQGLTLTRSHSPGDRGGWKDCPKQRQRRSGPDGALS